MSDSPTSTPRATGRVQADRTLGTRRKDKPAPTHEPGRECWCGKPISQFNPNDTCWAHTPVKYPRTRGVR